MAERIALTDQWEESEPGSSTSVTELGLVQDADGGWAFATQDETLDGGIERSEQTVSHGGAFPDRHFAPRYFAPRYWVAGGTSSVFGLSISDATPFNVTPFKIGNQIVVRG